MLNPGYMIRMVLVDMAMHGVVEVEMRRQNGTSHTFQCTLLPSSLECAKENADLYYASIGSSRYKEKQKKKREKALEEAKTWEQLVDDSINFLYVVDAETFRFKRISARRLVSVKGIEYIR